ncbi:Nitrogen permease regulator 3 [Oleoguttula sp. CCFEE 5521]
MGYRHNGLLAVLLVTRSRPGPKLVFRYPLSSAAPDLVSRDQSSDDEDDGSNFDAGLSGQSDAITERSTAIAPKRGNPDHREDDNFVRQLGLGAERSDDAGARGPRHGLLLDLNSESLERVLAPGRWSDVFVKNDRQPAKGPEREQRPRSPSADGQRVGNEAIGNVPAENESMGGSSNTPAILGSLDSTVSGDASLGTSATSSSSHGVSVTERLDMFHVVFAVASSGAKGAKVNANQIHEHVAKPLSRALEYLEIQDNYVSLESKKLLLSLQAEHQNHSSEAVYANSELATALRDLFVSLRQNEVASVSLDHTALMLLIPESNTLSMLSEKDIFASAIMLLDDKSSILSSLSSDTSSPLSSLIRAFKPTKALSKIAAALAMSTTDILEMVRHLLHYRKARLIVPLHAGNVYTASPDLPLHRLEGLGVEWAHRFASLPGLLSLLPALGKRYTKWGEMAEDRSERDIWMEGLAWLIRKDVLVLVKTVGWARLPKQEHGEEDQESEWTLITDPAHLSEAEEYRVDLMIEELGKTDVELGNRLLEMLRLLDGEHALESFPARLGVKRAKFQTWMTVLKDRGWLHTAQVV